MEVDLSSFNASNPEYLNKRREGFVDYVSEYTDDDAFDTHFCEDLSFALNDLYQYHQTKATKLHALLVRLGLMS